MTYEPICNADYRTDLFVSRVTEREGWNKQDSKRANRAIRIAEEWARERPVSLMCLSSQDTPTDEQLEQAQEAAFNHVRKVMSAGLGMLVWWIIFQIVKTIIYLWIEELFFNRTAYRAVMEG